MLRPSSGDGQASPLPQLSVPPVPSRRGLVVVSVVPASAVPRGPRLPLVLARVRAGFPSPADDYVEGRLDLHELTGAARPSCFFLRVEGESMTGAGIHDGDVLVVDRALTPAHGDIVVAALDGEMTVKRVCVRGRGASRRVRLLAANPAFPALEITEEQELVVWGVVTHSFRDHRGPRGRRSSGEDAPGPA